MQENKRIFTHPLIQRMEKNNILTELEALTQMTIKIHIEENGALFNAKLLCSTLKSVIDLDFFFCAYMGREIAMFTLFSIFLPLWEQHI